MGLILLLSTPDSLTPHTPESTPLLSTPLSTPDSPIPHSLESTQCTTQLLSTQLSTPDSPTPHSPESTLCTTLLLSTPLSTMLALSRPMTMVWQSLLLELSTHPMLESASTMKELRFPANCSTNQNQMITEICL